MHLLLPHVKQKKGRLLRPHLLVLSLLLVNVTGEYFTPSVRAAIWTQAMWPSQFTTLRTTHQMNCTQRMMRTPPASAGFRYSTFWNSTHNNFLLALSDNRGALFPLRSLPGYFACSVLYYSHYKKYAAY